MRINNKQYNTKRAYFVLKNKPYPTLPGREGLFYELNVSPPEGRGDLEGVYDKQTIHLRFVIGN